MEIKNLKKAAERIRKAIIKKPGQLKEKIILYGDADLDGAASVIILQDTIKSLGGKVSDVYFPDRELEGYGLTLKGLNFLKKHAPALLIILDCGISNVKEVEKAKEIGFEVIIIDHHEPLDEIPKTEIIVDPKQKDDNYPFKGLSSGGLAFILAEKILGKKITESLRNNLLEMAALSTIADMVPREEENKMIIEEGISSLKNSWRPGIRAFLEEEMIDDTRNSFLPFSDSQKSKNYSNINYKINKIISILNVREVENRFPASYRLFNSSSLEESKLIVKELLEKSKLKRQKIEEITIEVEKKIIDKDEPIIFEGGENFDSILISSVASFLCQKYLKPVFLYKKLAKESYGTVRSTKEINSVSLMKNCSSLLITFGGHAAASGFRLKNKNIEKFRNCLIKNI